MDLHLKNLWDYYKSIHSDDISEKIQNFYTSQKYEKVKGLDYKNLSKDFYNHNLHPKDFDIELVINPPNFLDMVQIIATMPVGSQIGRSLRIGVWEKTTKSWLGFIQLSSPLLQVKPRNDYFGCKLTPEQVNKFIYNGSIIIPAQPFGFNYLGGKLLTYICLSEEVKSILKQKYPQSEPTLFETTSLWGSVKGFSQYDTIRPHIKSRGLTISTNPIIPPDYIWYPARDFYRKKYNLENPQKLDGIPTAVKTREFDKIFSLIKKDYKSEKMVEEIIIWKKLPTQKKFYTSNWGIKNAKEVILFGENPIKENGWSLSELVNLWKVKAGKRFETLIGSGSFKKEIELWNIDTCFTKKDIVR